MILQDKVALVTGGTSEPVGWALPTKPFTVRF